jgi:hypothetical protein
MRELDVGPAGGARTASLAFGCVSTDAGTGKQEAPVAVANAMQERGYTALLLTGGFALVCGSVASSG